MNLLKFLQYLLFFLSVVLYSVQTNAEIVCDFKIKPTSQIDLAEILSSSKVNLFSSSPITSDFLILRRVSRLGDSANTEETMRK